MLVADVLTVIGRPARGFAAVAGRRLLPSVTLVVCTGLAALGLSVAASVLEPDAPTRSADVGFSLALPVLFVGFWVIDALIVDAVAQLMGARPRLRSWLAASAYAMPLLVLYGGVRLLQALLDRGGQQDVGIAVGYADLAVLGWFLCLIAIGIRGVYGLPGISAFAAALAPPASMATLLVFLLVVVSVLHLAGAG